MSEKIQTQIDIQLKGSRDLLKFNEGVKKLTKSIEQSVKSINQFQKKNELTLKSINNLNSSLSATKTNFNNVALGTKDATQAAELYLKATTEVNAALAVQNAAVVSLQNARKSDAYFLAQSARAGKANALAEKESAQQSVEIARARNVEIQAQLRNQELAKEVQTRAPRLPAFQERGFKRLEDEFKTKEQLLGLEEKANKASKRRLNFQEKQNKEIQRQKNLGIGVNKNEKLINASFEERVKFAKRNGQLRREALQRANALLITERKINQQRAAGAKGRTLGQGLKGGLSNALIGGGFPLLFGQSPLAALGGGLGGLAGGIIGGGFGFALSIVGTAIGSAVSESIKFNKSLNELNNRLLAVGGTSRITSKDFKELRKAIGGNRDETLQLLGELGRFGAGGDDVGKALGKNASKIISSIASVTNDESTLTKALKDNVDILTIARVKELQAELKGLPVQEKRNKLLQEFINIQAKSKLNRRETDALLQTTQPGFFQTLNPFGANANLATNRLKAKAKIKKTTDLNITPQLQEEIDLQGLNKPSSSNQTEINTEKQQNAILKTRIGLIKTGGSLLDEERKKLEVQLISNTRLLEIAEAKGNQDKIALANKKAIANTAILEAEIAAAKTEDDERKAELIKNTMDNLQDEKLFLQESLSLGIERAKQEKLIRDLVKIVGEDRKAEVIALVQGNAADREKVNLLLQQEAIQKQIEGILSGGMTNAVMGLIEGTKTLSESLAGIARQLASMFLNRAFGSMFDKIFGGEQGGYLRSGSFKAFQYGGVVSSPTLGMIGEGGEPEYVIPSSKMDGAMARYSAGARGGAVIPGGSGASGTVAGSSGNTIVEYTGPVLNFNGDEYVPKDSVPQIINAAAKQGATLGQSRTLNTLKNSRSSRAKIGI